MSRFPAGRLLRLIALAGIPCFSAPFCIPASGGPSSQPGTAADKMKIKVDVDEVRLDVVVVDGKGRQITDLTADDFEVYQDRRRQEINSVTYINQDLSSLVNKADKSSEPGSLIPVPMLKREEVRRTMVFLVNDLIMNFGDVYRTRMSLSKYIKEQMQPGDLISILKTSRGTATLQAFTSDKKELLARVENIQWNPGPSVIGGSESSYGEEFNRIWESDGIIDEDEEQSIAIKYCIKALENMPGRKYIMLMTPKVTLPHYSNPNDINVHKLMAEYSRMAEAALRAGVVVHTLYIKGLTMDDIPMDASKKNYNEEGLGSLNPGKNPPNFIPLSEKTGGLLHYQFNFFLDGIGDVNEQIKGYYLLSYTPPPNTFSKSKNGKFHSVKIKVKRRGASVQTRNGFFSDPEIYELPAVSPPPLVEAMFSPFQYNDLGIDLASGFLDNAEIGYLLPTWMHLDGKNLGIKEEPDGSRSVFFKAGASTTDIDGIFQDYGDIDVKFHVDENDIQRLREKGINFTVSIPVKKPGGHYVRAAVEDQVTHAKGSAYQFIEIPDLKKDRLTLSSIYIIDGDEDAGWIRSMAAGDSSEASDTPRHIAKRNPAYKNFRSGDSFEYMAVIYNAKIQKANPPELECRTVLYKDGAELSQTDFEPVDVSGTNDYKRIPLRRTLHIDNTMPPGDYVLQLLIRDIYGKPKQNLAAQSLNFRITAQ